MSIVPVPSSKTSLHCMKPIQERKTLSETCEQFFKVKNQMGQTNSGCHVMVELEMWKRRRGAAFRISDLKPFS